MRTLVLNAGYEPLGIVSFKRALVLVLNEKATIVESDEASPIRTSTLSYACPSVILLTRYVKIPSWRQVPVSRRGVLRRDAQRCVYCNASATTIDHVQPRSRGGLDSWENLVACCLDCNNLKSNRTPAEMGWKLRASPRMPHHPGWFVRGIEWALPEWEDYLQPAA